LSLLFPEKYYLFYFLALIAEILGTVSGFGSSILFVPLAAYFFDFHEVLGITALFHVFSNLSKMFLFREGINIHIVKTMGISAILSVIIGAVISKYAPVKELEIFLSIFMIAISILLLTGIQKKVHASNTNLIIGGSLSGFIAGLIGTGGAIRGITLAAFQIEKNTFIPTSAIIDMGVDSSRLLIYIYNGFIQTNFLYMIPALILISMLGSWIGKKILIQLSESVFQKIVLGVIFTLALVQLIKNIFY
jgi:uncharacterized membrane protein YfcA